MKIVVTILEETFEAALGAIRALALDHDAVELRAEGFGSIDLTALRESTGKVLLLTHRGEETGRETIAAAIGAGIDLVDLEYQPGLDRELIERYAGRLVLSHHDYRGFPDVERLMGEMRAFGCLHTKLAVTPATLEDNLRLLRAIAPSVTVIGMGERGLYSRILAPFLGSGLAFVAPAPARSGAPGQLSLESALAIYGDDRERTRATHVFAIAGHPAGHSLSPAIHNTLFREKGADAAYTIASFEKFEEIAASFQRGAIRGLSVTAPFKEEALRFAVRVGAQVGENARACGAANTLVHAGRGILADNTDVDGFSAILRQICGRNRKSVAVAGAGGTARAALVAVAREGMHATLFNRTPDRAEGLARQWGIRWQPLHELPRFDGEIIINTLPPASEIALDLKPGAAYVEAAYGDPRLVARCSGLALDGVQVFDGFDLLRAQAVRQNEIFMRSLHGL